LKIDNY